MIIKIFDRQSIQAYNQLKSMYCLTVNVNSMNLSPGVPDMVESGVDVVGM